MAIDEFSRMLRCKSSEVDEGDTFVEIEVALWKGSASTYVGDKTGSYLDVCTAVGSSDDVAVASALSLLPCFRPKPRPRPRVAAISSVITIPSIMIILRSL